MQVSGVVALSDPNGLIEIIIGQGRAQDRVAVVLEIGRLDAARSRLPAVEEENGHWHRLSHLGLWVISPELAVEVDTWSDCP